MAGYTNSDFGNGGYAFDTTFCNGCNGFCCTKTCSRALGGDETGSTSFGVRDSIPCRASRTNSNWLNGRHGFITGFANGFRYARANGRRRCETAANGLSRTGWFSRCRGGRRRARSLRTFRFSTDGIGETFLRRVLAKIRTTDLFPADFRP